MDSYGRTVEQAKPYLTDPVSVPDIRISSYRDGFKERFPEISDDDAEYLGTGGSFYKEILNFQGFQFHASAVVVDERAYLFSAHSGTGKSTHTGLWLKEFGDRAYILNDDKPALRLIDDTWYAFGTPWSGKHDISVNIGVPVAGICMIERGECNEIAPFCGKNAIHAIIAQSLRPTAAEYRMKLLGLLDDLITRVPVWKLKCNMDPEAARVSYEAMSGRKMEE
jgi:hypothetical protein